MDEGVTDYLNFWEESGKVGRTHTFGGLLRSLRENAGKSIGQLARHLGVTTSYISNVELGKELPLNRHLIVEAADLFQIKPDQLLNAAAIPLAKGGEMHEVKKVLSDCISEFITSNKINPDGVIDGLYALSAVITVIAKALEDRRDEDEPELGVVADDS